MTPSLALGQGVPDKARNRDLMRKDARSHLSILVAAAAVVAVSESEGAGIENVHRRKLS